MAELAIQGRVPFEQDLDENSQRTKIKSNFWAVPGGREQPFNMSINKAYIVLTEEHNGDENIKAFYNREEAEEYQRLLIERLGGNIDDVLLLETEPRAGGGRLRSGNYVDTTFKP